MAACGEMAGGAVLYSPSSLDSGVGWHLHFRKVTVGGSMEEGPEGETRGRKAGPKKRLMSIIAWARRVGQEHLKAALATRPSAVCLVPGRCPAHGTSVQMLPG